MNNGFRERKDMLNMKKRIMSLAAAAVLFLFASACSCISVNINIRPAASKDYSTVFEQSELRWYISEKYGEKAVSDYCFYDLDDHGEVSCVVAQRYTSGNGPEMLMHVFNRDIADWYCYNNDILVSARSEKYTEIEGIGPVYRLTMYADIDPRNEYTIDSGTYYVYLTDNKSGLLDRIFLDNSGDRETGTAGRYEYKFIVNGVWQIDDNNPNFVSNDMGSLNSVIEVGED